MKRSLHALVLSMLFTFEAFAMPLVEASNDIPKGPSFYTQIILNIKSQNEGNPLFEKAVEIVNNIDPNLLSDPNLEAQANNYSSVHYLVNAQFNYIFSNIWNHGNDASMDLLTGSIGPEKRWEEGEKLLLSQSRIGAYFLLSNLFYNEEELKKEVGELASSEHAFMLMSGQEYVERLNNDNYAMYQYSFKSPEEMEREYEERVQKEKRELEEKATALLEEKIKPRHYKEIQSFIEDVPKNPKNTSTQAWQEVSVSGKTFYIEFVKDEETTEALPNLIRYFIDKNRERIESIAKELALILKGTLSRLDSINAMIFLQGLITRALAKNTDISHKEFGYIKTATCMLDVPDTDAMWTKFSLLCPEKNPQNAKNMQDDVYRSISLREALNNAVEVHSSFKDLLSIINVVPQQDGSWKFEQNFNLDELKAHPFRNQIGEAFSYIFSPSAWTELLNPNRNYDLLVGQYAIKKDGTVRLAEEFRAEIDGILQNYMTAQDQYLTELTNIHGLTSKIWHSIYSSVDYAILYWYDAIGAHPMTDPYDFNPEHSPELLAWLDTIRTTQKKLESAGAHPDEIQAIMENNKMITAQAEQIRTMGDIKMSMFKDGVMLLAVTAISIAAAPLVFKGVSFMAARTFALAKKAGVAAAAAGKITYALGSASSTAAAATHISTKTNTLVRLAQWGSKIAGINTKVGAGQILAQLFYKTIASAANATGHTLKFISAIAGIRPYGYVAHGEVLSAVPTSTLMKLTASFLHAIRIPANYVTHLTTRYSLPGGGLPSMLWNFIIKWPVIISGITIAARSAVVGATQGILKIPGFALEESIMAVGQTGSGIFGASTKGLLGIKDPQMAGANQTNMEGIETKGRQEEVEEISITDSPTPTAAGISGSGVIASLDTALANIGSVEFALLMSAAAQFASKNGWTRRYLMTLIFGSYMLYGSKGLLSQARDLDQQRKQAQEGLKAIQENYNALSYNHTQHLNKYSHLSSLFESFNKFPTGESRFLTIPREMRAKLLLLESEEKRLTKSLDQMADSNTALWLAGATTAIFIGTFARGAIKTYKAGKVDLGTQKYDQVMLEVRRDMMKQLGLKDSKKAMDVFENRIKLSRNITNQDITIDPVTNEPVVVTINQALLKSIEKVLGKTPTVKQLAAIEEVIKSTSLAYPYIDGSRLENGKFLYTNAMSIKPGFFQRLSNYVTLRMSFLSAHQIKALQSQGLLFNVPSQQYQHFFSTMNTLVPNFAQKFLGEDYKAKQNPYLTLVVSEKANMEQIDAAYKKQLDFVESYFFPTALNKEAQIKQINVAYETLKNPKLRADLDKTLHLKPNYFAILEINPSTIKNLSDKKIEDNVKKAYRRLSMKYHPDRYPGDPEARAQFEIVNESYLTLRDPIQREIYMKDYPHYLKENVQAEEVIGPTAGTRLAQTQELHEAFAKRFDQNLLRLLSGEKVDPSYNAIFKQNGITDIMNDASIKRQLLRIDPTAPNYFAMFGLEPKIFNNAQNIAEYKDIIEESFKDYENQVTRNLPQLSEAEKEVVGLQFSQVSRAKATLTDPEKLKTYQEGLGLGENPITETISISDAVNTKGKTFFEIFNVDRNLLKTEAGEQELMAQVAASFNQYATDYDAKYESLSLAEKKLAEQSFELVSKAYTTLTKAELREEYLNLANL